MSTPLDSWQFWALMSAGFAALTAIFAKVGIAGIDSDFATLIRTCVILVVLTVMVFAMGKAQPLDTIPPRSWLFLVLSGLATGASWLAYFRALKIGQASEVAPVDKLSVVLVAVFGMLFLGKRLTLQGWIGVGLVTAGAVTLAVKL